MTVTHVISAQQAATIFGLSISKSDVCGYVINCSKELERDYEAIQSALAAFNGIALYDREIKTRMERSETAEDISAQQYLEKFYELKMKYTEDYNSQPIRISRLDKECYHNLTVEQLFDRATYPRYNW